MARRSRGSDGGPWHAPALQPRRQRSCVFVGLVAENQYFSSVLPAPISSLLRSNPLPVLGSPRSGTVRPSCRNLKCSTLLFQ